MVAGGAAPGGTLRRRIGPVLLTFYGVGVMVGAGIYVLVGKIAALTGPFAPLAFVLAALIALPVALSYAELSSRLPEAAGEVAYVESGLGRPLLAAAAGLGIVIAGTVSAAVVLRGGTGYLVSLLPLPPEAVMVALALGLTAVAVAGVLESLALAAVMTAIEVGGLALVILAGTVGTPVEAAPAPAGGWLAGMGPAVLLAFFAFIGFEDMVNLAEETRDPTRTMPRAIIAALALTAALYLSVAWAAVRVATPAELGGSERPLALVFERGLGLSAAPLAAIAVVAALNGILAQMVMAARILYGLGRRWRALAPFARVSPRFGTPARATVLVGAAVLAAALALPIERLAEATSVVLLIVFSLVCGSLIALRRRAPEAPFRAPRWAPWAGLAASLAALCWALAG